MKRIPAKKTINLFRIIAGGFAPPPLLTVSEWADENRVLRSSTSAEPGPWDTDRVPYMREIMDCMSATSLVQDVALMKGAQLAGSESGNNWIGYIIDQTPGPTMLIQPTVDLAKKYSQQRIAPLISDSPKLAAKVKDPRSRDSGNTILTKEFPGGVLVMTGANSAAGLRSMPVCNLFMDEVDAYPADVEGEGDPVDLAMARTRTFSLRRKVLKVSTPTIRGISRIETEYLESDRRKYFVPCPGCGHMHPLEWGNFIIPTDDKTGKRRPQLAHMVCPECGSVIEERHKPNMLANGEWRMTAPQNYNPKRRGYHISSLYSPLGWFSWADIAEQWLKAQGKTKRLKTFVNTILGETWEELGEGIEAQDLLKRREAYNCEVPQDVLVLTCSVDVQDNRLEYDVKGWGVGFERWAIEYGVIMGDPGQMVPVGGQKTVWQMLDDIILHRVFTRKDGQQLQIMTTCIDSGGHHTEAVYKYCKAREFRRVWAIKGQGGSGIPFIQRPKKRNSSGVWLFMLGVDVGKDLLASRLKIAFEGAGYCHYPTDPKKGYDLAYFEGLTAEHRVTKYTKGRPSIHWEKRTSGARNEPFDLENYNTAAIEILNPPFEVLKQQMNGSVDATESPTKKAKPAQKRSGVISKGIG